jgi:neutral ceramidase
MRDSLRTGVPLAPVPAELCALRFGDVALVTAPGEIFNETGTEVKRRSPLPRTCYVAYTNGTIGYVPIPAAYPEGGYEVTHACRVGPEAAPMITETSLRLLEAVAGSA